MDFVDQMDLTRVVRPLQTPTSNPNIVEVRVFWRQRKGDQEIRVPGGTAFIPKRLLMTGEEHQYDALNRTGFIPETKAAPLPKPKKRVKAEPKVRRNEEDYED